MVRVRTGWTLGALTLTVSAGAGEPRLGRLGEPAIDDFLRAVQQSPGPLAERVARVSARLVGTRYVRDPLGEGSRGRRDRDPLIDLARVDCLTFVEQVLALSQRSTLRQASELLQRYRYAGSEARYHRRRHFMELQWLPGLAGEGLLRDVTREVAGEAARTFEREVRRESYRNAFRRWRRRLGDELPVGTIRLAYVPAREAPGVAARIPDGAVMSLLRRTPRDWPVTITHVGFVVRQGQGRVFRHAIARAGRVVDEALGAYLSRHARDPASLGFHLALPLPAQEISAQPITPKITTPKR